MAIEQDSVGLPEGSPYARHIPALDGVRGFAVLGVAASHLFSGTPHNNLQWHVQAMLNYGAVGVDLFFVLSGFLITGILFDSLGDPVYFKKFYARRALRIFPLYYGMLAIFGMLAIMFGGSFHRELLSLALYMQNSFVIAVPITQYAGSATLPLTHFWSLAVEEQFYLVWPVTVFLLRKQARLLRFSVAAIVLCPLLRIVLLWHGADSSLVHINTVCRADSLLAGGALALLLRSPYHLRTLRAGAWLFPFCAAALAVSRFLPDVSQRPALYLPLLSIQYSLLAFASVSVLCLSLISSLGKRLFSSRVLRTLGRYSYGLYVLHVPLFFYLQAPLRTFIARHLTPNTLVGIALTGVIVFLLSIAAASLSFAFFEQPFLRLKRFFSYGAVMEARSK